MTQEGQIYEGDNGTIVECTSNLDISSATNVNVEIQAPPSGEIHTVPGTIEGTNTLLFTLTSTIIAKAGTYKFQPIITLGTWTGRGSTEEFEVSKKFT